LAAFVDDVGVAISFWTSQLMMTTLFEDQRSRAAFMMPVLVSFLLGSIVAGPLADWGRRRGTLAEWRWRLIIGARVAETFAMGLLVVLLRLGGTPTISLVLPYFLIAAFVKTAVRPARIAFEVDLLTSRRVQVDENENVVVDDVGRPLYYKPHLLTVTSLVSFLGAAATLIGLLCGAGLLSAVSGDFATIYLLDVLTNVVFIVVFALACRPARETFELESEHSPTPGAQADGVLAQLAGTLREVFAFLRRPEQRPLLCLLFGGWLVEVITEFYDGRMIIKHLLGGADDHVRFAQIAWSIVSLATLALLPVLASRVSRLGRIFLVVMLLDGLALALAGHLAAGSLAAVAPFAAVLGVDRALTDTSSTLMNLAQNSACRASLRGRLAAAWAFAVLVAAFLAQGAATVLAGRVGIPRMLTLVGASQVALMLALSVLAGRTLWNYGFRAQREVL
jgi:hypothetical protein